jgi:hypothetical protein
MGEYVAEDRRGASDGSSGRERRCVFGDLTYCGIERRSYVDRRCGEERRKWFRLFLKLRCKPLFPPIINKRTPGQQSILR